MSGANQSVKSKKNRKWLLWAAALGIGLLCFAGIWLLDRVLVSSLQPDC